MASKTLTAALTGTLVLLAPLAAAETAPPAGRQVAFATVAATPAEHAKTIKTLTGTDVDVAGLDAKPVKLPPGKLPFWDAVERLAAATGSRIVTTGGRISLRPGESRAASCARGPFRFAVREVSAKIDSETGRANYEVIVDTCWEPWLLAYRMDSTPADGHAKNDRGGDLPIAKSGARTPTSGNAASFFVRPAGVTRLDKSVSLKGRLRFTIADELLTFTFDADKPVATSRKGVSASIAKFGKDDGDWFAVFSLKYPPSEVVIESFEEALLRNNTVRLIDPKGHAYKADLEEPADSRYTFKKRANQVGPGWKLEYRTPGPMREISVPFELKDIKLP